MKDSQRKAMFAKKKSKSGFTPKPKAKQYKVFYKNIYTKNKWKEHDVYSSIASAGANAEFIRAKVFIMGKDSTGKTKPSPKTITKIIRVDTTT